MTNLLISLLLELSGGVVEILEVMLIQFQLGPTTKSHLKRRIRNLKHLAELFRKDEPIQPPQPLPGDGEDI